MSCLKIVLLIMFSFCCLSAWRTTAFSDDLTCYYTTFPTVTYAIPMRGQPGQPPPPPQQFCRHRTEVKVINMAEKDIIDYSIEGTRTISGDQVSIRDKMPPINPKQTVYKAYTANTKVY